MVYIDRDGRVLERRPWDFARVKEIFTTIWFLVVHFFMTLVGPFRGDNKESNNSRRSGWGGGGGGGGGGSSGGSGGGGGGLRPNRRIGRITNTMDCNIPGGG